MPGAMARLLTEDWDQMTNAANKSAMHVSSRERWFRKAKEANPALTDEQAARLGELMRKAHYVKMGRLSAQARRLAREAQAELKSAGEPCDGTA
jgi:hypothetical protein